MRLLRFATCLLLLSAAWPALAQDRVTKVQNDRKEFSDDEQWIYNDLPRAFAQAKASGKPLMVVFRCIP